MYADELMPWLVAGLILLTVIGGLICYVWILVIAFAEGVLHGLGCLLCGPYTFYYCATRWRRCSVPFLIALSLNIGMAIVQFQSGASDSMERVVTSLEQFRESSRETPAEKIARDMQHLQGKWTLRVGGGGGPQQETFEFDGETCIVRGEHVTHHFDFLLSRSGWSCLIDLTNRESGETLEGIYRLEGDHFTLCLAGPGQPRPDRFLTWGDQQRRFELQRAAGPAEQSAQLAPNSQPPPPEA